MGNTNPLGHMLAYAALILTMFFMAINFVTNLNMTKEDYAVDEVTQFVDSCSVTGKIDPNNLDELIADLGKAGFYIEMSHDSYVCYPDASGVIKDYITYNDNYIYSKMYDTSATEAEAYIMKTKDEFTVTVRRNANQFVNMVNGVFHADFKGSIVGGCTREIGNSNN